MSTIKTAGEQLREAAHARRLTFDRTGLAHCGKNHKLCLATATHVRIDKLPEFADMSLHFPDETGMSEHTQMSNLFAKWVDVLEFQHAPAKRTLVWEMRMPPSNSQTDEYVNLFDWLKFVYQEPLPDSCS